MRVREEGEAVAGGPKHQLNRKVEHDSVGFEQGHSETKEQL